MKRLAAVPTVLAALALAAGSATASAPAGATARCRDGTYSFSLHHSGTCSHHGGVATWLEATTTPAATTQTGVVGVIVGRTVLLGVRTRTAGCTLGANPDRRCSPGAYSSGLRRTVLCSPSFRTGTIRDVPQSEKYAVEREYGLAPALYGSTLEIDHIVSLELGGANVIANLYPELADAHPGYHVKDTLENRLHDLVCSGAMTLRAAQTRIASNWQSLYLQVYGLVPRG